MKQQDMLSMRISEINTKLQVQSFSSCYENKNERTTGKMEVDEVKTQARKRMTADRTKEKMSTESGEERG